MSWLQGHLPSSDGRACSALGGNHGITHVCEAVAGPRRLAMAYCVSLCTDVCSLFTADHILTSDCQI